MSDVGMSPATMLVTLLLAQRAAAEAENGVAGDLLEDLLAAPPENTEHLCARAQRLGRDLASPHVLVAVHVVKEKSERSWPWAAAYAHRNRGLTTQRHGWLIIMLPGQDPQAVADRVVVELRRAIGHPVTAGAAGPVTSLQHVHGAYQEALSCGRVLLALGRTAEAAVAEGLGFIGLLLKGKPELAPFVDATIGPLLRYDARRGTALRDTLRAYLDSGQKLSRTARKLHIHINTAAQRLSRITVVLGPGWQDPQRMLDIQVALTLHEVSHAFQREAVHRDAR
ncbi:helix-turn-helix domain-containing protein [Streptomyces sp. L2]|uniref:PucR family transcriptional regulator n=1 Tax=Streptomyces sp. L2 TaxID=2162665 RepID=UPI0013E905A6|nr:helix-turn-helix domain-containing protein [Streptomyces sp. L2]